MNLADRVRNMLLRPKTEWDIIAGEQPDTRSILKGYVVPLILIGSAAAFIGYGFIGDSSMHNSVGIGYGLSYAISKLIVGIVSIYTTSIVVNELAPSFDSVKNFGRSFQLVAYGATPVLVAVFFALIPALENIARLAGGIYCIYLWYLGLQPVMKTPEHKTITYLVVAFIALIVVYAILGALLAAIVFPLFGV